MVDLNSVARLRVDKWLWFSRVFKSRSLASSMVKSGKVRLNSERFSSPSRTVVPGDVLTITLDRQIKVLKIVKLGARRGPAPEAQTLYEDLSPPVEVANSPIRSNQHAIREEGAGRPSKKERRQLNRFRTQAGEEFE